MDESHIRFRAGLRSQTGVDADYVTEACSALRVTYRGGHLQVPRAPSGLERIAIRYLGTGGIIRFEDPPRRFHLVIPAEAEAATGELTLILEAGAGRSVTIDCEQPDRAIDLEIRKGPARLALRGPARFTLKQPMPGGSAMTLIGPDPSLGSRLRLTMPGKGLGRVFLAGDCEIGVTNNLAIDRVRLLGACQLRNSGNTTVSVRRLVRGSRVLTLANPCQLHVIDFEGGAVRLVDSVLRITRGAQLSVTGSGHVEVLQQLVDSAVSGLQDGPLQLHLDRDATAVGIRGAAEVIAAPGSRLTGDPRSSFSVLKLVCESPPIELESVDVCRLSSISDLIPFRNAVVLTPAVPRRARRTQDAMRLKHSVDPRVPARFATVRSWRSRLLGPTPGDPGAGTRDQLTAFWKELSHLVETRTSNLKVRNQVEYLASRARRRHLQWRTERVWLSLYALTGYGRRLFQPAALYAGTVVIGALVYTETLTPGIELDRSPVTSYGEAAWLMFRAPLTLIRVGAEITFASIAAHALVLAVGILGALFGFLIASNLRRLVRG